MLTKSQFSKAFTLVELVITIVVIGIISTISVVSFTGVQKDARDSARKSQVTVVANALEKYYEDNNEYPSVALVASQDVPVLKSKLKIKDADVLKLPTASSSTTSSIVNSNPSTTRVVYSANTTDASKNSQCQIDVNGYCDGFQLQYIKEADGTPEVFTSRRTTFTPVSGTTDCAAGETRSGDTCTRTYTATSQPGTYSCPSGGTLSGTTCSSSYAASYASTGIYTCPSGGTLSGTTCSSSYAASQGATTYSCPSGGSLSGTSCRTPATVATTYVCPHSSNDIIAGNQCAHTVPAYTTYTTCNNANTAYDWSSAGYCYYAHAANIQFQSYSCGSGYAVEGQTGNCIMSATATPGEYTCPSGGTLSGTTCSTSYTATYVTSGYICPSGGTLSGTTCTYPATYSSDITICDPGHTYSSGGYCVDSNGNYYSGTNGGYYCPSGGTLSGTTCSYTATYQNGSGYYYCTSGGSLSGSTCYSSYPATSSGTYYYCAQGGTVSGTTCTYTYPLP